MEVDARVAQENESPVEVATSSSNFVQVAELMVVQLDLLVVKILVLTSLWVQNWLAQNTFLLKETEIIHGKMFY